MNAIKISKLTKKFKEFIAVNSISLEIKEGEFFGLLGPNGAGKTTTIAMLSTILSATSGEIEINGYDLTTSKDAVRKSIGIVFQDHSLDDELTGWENLDFHGRLYGLGHKLRNSRIKEVLRLVELEDRANNLVKTFSGGMKRRLEIARGLIHHPKVLFLDEPTLGLDPQTRRRLWYYLRKLNKSEKITVILTTHYMDEADFLCNRIAIIDHGKIIALDTPTSLKKILGGDVITIESKDSEKLLKVLSQSKEFKEIKRFDHKLNIVVADGSKSVPKLISAADKEEISIDSVTIKQPSLEDVFIHYTGRSIREEFADSKEDFRLQMKLRGRR